MSTAAPTLLWVALGVVPALVALTRLLRVTPAGQDEVWFLLVATRLSRGRRLYTEVFYGAGPLPAWGAAVLVRRCGAGLRAMRTWTAALLMATTVLLLLLVAAGGAGLGILATAIAMSGLVLAWPPDNTYGVAARAGAVLAVVALAASDPALVTPDPFVHHPLVLASISGLGLVMALFAKNTLGGAAALTVVPGWLLVAGLAPAAVAAGTTALGSIAVLALLARRHELHGFVRRTLTDKGTYVATGRLSFTSAARDLATLRPTGWWVDLPAYAVTVAAVLGSAVALAAGTHGAVEAVCLATVSLAGTYPRADPMHVRAGAAPALVALVVVLASVPTAAAAAVTALAILGAAGLVASWRQHPRRAPEAGATALDGLPMLSPMSPQAAADGGRVRELAGRRVLVLRPDAAQVVYFALDLRNPTAYDYPLASTFGSEGQEVVAARLRRSDIEWCLFAPAGAGELTPSVLEEAVCARMDPVLETARWGSCSAPDAPDRMATMSPE